MRRTRPMLITIQYASSVRRKRILRTYCCKQKVRIWSVHGLSNRISSIRGHSISTSLFPTRIALSITSTPNPLSMLELRVQR